MQAHSHSTVGNHCGLLVVSNFNSSPWSPLLSTCQWSSWLNQFLPNNSALSIQRYTADTKLPFRDNIGFKPNDLTGIGTHVSTAESTFLIRNLFRWSSTAPDDIYVVAEICRSCLTACSVKVRRCKISEFSTKWLSFKYLKISRCI